jgi:PKD repeat protein
MTTCLYGPLMRLAAVAASLLAAQPPQATSTSSSPNPLVIFSSPGSKTVTLRVCNSGGCSTKTTTLQVLDPSPKTSPIAGPIVVGTAQPPAAYTSTLTGKPPLSRTWTLTYPDASSLSSNGTVFSLSPLQVGPHTLALQASNLSGTASTTLPISVLPNAFADVPPDHWAAYFINAFYYSGFTSGCGPDPVSGFPRFCPLTLISRAELAVFLGRALHPPPFQPSAPRGIFADVPPSSSAAAWIEQIFRDGITGGCQVTPLRLFCPNNPITRAEMAVLLTAAFHGPLFSPPPASGLFLDVPTSYWAARWIEQIFRDGTTGGCQGPPQRLFCPGFNVTRAEIAVFVSVAFRLAQQPVPTTFLARLCSASSCGYPSGLPLDFDIKVFGGIPQAYDFDWDGNGTWDQTSAFPLAHTYTTAGRYTPRMRLRLGTFSRTIVHPYPITITTSSGLLAPPTNLTATASSILTPQAGDPPGTPIRVAYTVNATPPPGLVRGYAAYVNSGVISTFAGLLPVGAAGSLLLPPIPLGATSSRYLSLLAFTNNTRGSGSIGVRLP